VNGVDFSSNRLSSSRFFLARYPESAALPPRITMGTTHQIMSIVISYCILFHNLQILSDIKDVARRSFHLSLSGMHDSYKIARRPYFA
jgi:hypothetical protein